MPNKVAFYIPYFWSPHLEVDLELINKHVSAGDQVTVFVCGGELSTCFSNLEHERSICDLCIGRRRNGFVLTGLIDKVSVRNFVNIKDADLEILNRYKDVTAKTIADLKEIQLEQCSIGRAIHNELVCLSKESEPDLNNFVEYVTKCVESAALVYLSFKNNFAELKPDLFYTFNGRFVISQPAVAAARATKTHYALHDRAGVINRYCVVYDEPFHSADYWNKLILDTWENNEQPLAEKIRLGSEWFDGRVSGNLPGLISFTSDQKIALPAGFDRSKTNVAIFNSSEYEVAGMEEYQLPFYEDQNDALLKIARQIEDDPSLCIYLRVHPHLKDKDNAQTRFINEQLKNRFKNFVVIGPDEPIKSYELMKGVDAVVTFGSTVGVEAAYQGTPSILLRRTWYDQLGACFIPKSHDELIELLRTKRYQLSDEEREKRKIAALKYAYHFKVAGDEYRLFEQTDIFELRFRGDTVNHFGISNELPSYEKGLRLELAQRSELNNKTTVNPLASAVQELVTTADKLASENSRLAAELASLKAQSPTSAAPPRLRHRLRHKVSQIKRSLGDSMKKLIDPPQT